MTEDPEKLAQWRDDIRKKAEKHGWRQVLFEEWHWDLQNTDKTVFDLICDGLDENEFDRYRDSIVWELEPRPTDVVLNIGCGIGRVEKFLAPLVKRAIGIDFSESMIARAKERLAKLSNADFYVNDGERLDAIEDESVDLVFSELVFQHIPIHVAKSYFVEIHRILRPGGRGIVQVPTAGKYGEMPEELCAFMTREDLLTLLSPFQSVEFSAKYTNDQYHTPVFTKP